MSAAHSSLVVDAPRSSSKTSAPPLGTAARIAAPSSARRSSGRRGPGFVDLAKVDAGEADASRALRHSLEVTFEQQTLRSRLQFADANQREAHGLNSCSFLRADPRSTSFRDYRTGGHPGGIYARWRLAHRGGPSRKAACPRSFGDGKPASRQALTTRSAIAPTCTLERPEAMIIRSASVVFPASSIETMFSAFASSSPSTMICDKESAVGELPGTAGLRGLSAAAA